MDAVVTTAAPDYSADADKGVPKSVTQTPTGGVRVSLAGGLQATAATALRGSASATGTSATTITGMEAQGAGVKIYVTNVQVFRTDAGTTSSYVTLNDSASTKVWLPVGGGSSFVFSTPLVVAANTPLQFTPHDALTTVFANAQGFSGP